MPEHEARIKRNEEDIQDIWRTLEEIKKAMTYRLPLWAVGVFGMLCSALTCAITLLVHK